MSNAINDPVPSAVGMALSTSAKLWWGFSLFLKLTAFAGGLLNLASGVPPEAVAAAVAVLAIAGELADYKAAGLKGDASLLRRRLDLHDGLGWPISPAEYSDILVRRHSLIQGRAPKAQGQTYFASTSPPGPIRAIENTMESAWWSKHLANKMTVICLTASLLAVAASFAVLYGALIGASNPASRVLAGRVATSLLTFLASFGLIKLTVSYWQFASRAGRIEQQAIELQKQPSEADAIKLVQEYDLARHGAPLIPDWLWERHNATLNRLWERRRAPPTGNGNNS